MTVIKPDKETFIHLFNKAEGDFRVFNALLKETGEEPMSMRTFYRRKAVWTEGIDRRRSTKAAEERAELDTRPVSGGVVEAPDVLRESLEGTRYVFTLAQNNTDVHEQFLKNLLVFCEDRDAELVVGVSRYNKKGYQNYTKDNEPSELWFDPKIKKYIREESLNLSATHNGLVWCGDLDISPTAENPLSGLDNYTHTASSIIPHTKVRLQSVPVLKGDPVKMLYTTGAVTKRNYIPKKTGQKAAFHHVFGALFVEIDDDGDFFARQIIADTNGNFYELDAYYKDGHIIRCTPETVNWIEAINWGDIHSEKSDPYVARAGWTGVGCMLDVLRPRYQFEHDLTDFAPRNHHNVKNPLFLYQMYSADTEIVEEGLMDAALTLSNKVRDFVKTVVVESNHDQAFKRWLTEADISKDPANMYYYHKAWVAMLEKEMVGKPYNMFEWAIRESILYADELVDVIFLHEDESFVICGDNGIECGMHGHRGPNGARGNPNAFRKLGRKCNTGHTHSASIIDGVYTAGTSSLLDMGYNKGPSSWSHSHIITYPNGKRAIITMKNGKWRA